MRVIQLIFVTAALFGQTPPATSEKPSPQAPPEVDAALRARINQFYQFEVEGKFAKALQLVADDTKDLFVGSSKPTYQSFEIHSIRYSDDFTKAEVMLMVIRLLPIEGFMGHPVPTKMTSRWKLENGEWCYYVDPQKDLPMTPFGPLLSGGARVPLGGTPSASPVQPPPAVPIPNRHVLIPDRTSVQLKSSGPSSARVTISNASPFFAGLTVSDPKIAGLTVKLDPLTVRPGQRTVLSIQSNGAVQVPKTPITIVITIQQTNQTIPIQVSFVN